MSLQYDHLQKMVNDFKRFKELWTTTSDWLHWNESWLSDPLSSINPEQLQRIMSKAKETMNTCTEQFKDLPGRLHIYHYRNEEMHDYWAQD